MSKPTVVGITGGSGSGKTLFMKELMQQVPDAALHSMDNYYIEKGKQPKDKSGIENFDTPQSINQNKFAEDLKKLIAGESIELTEYTYNNERDNPNPKKIKIDSSPVILVEGIFVFHQEKVRELLDLKLYIEAPDYLMMKRRIIRDSKERGYDLDDVLYRYEHHVTPAYKQYIEPSKHFADLIIPNHEHFENALKVITAFLNQ
ncbi:uridine-cytidine kinase [Ekhidna sp. MALMAid0563]|uniref:uridine kinase family protein n=1 Tax=Ekhidna sp. MALMAid0563 TaxID=3143937 RepID=UPI0032DE3F13